MHQVHAAAEQVTRLAQTLRIDVGHRQGAATQQRGDLLGINAVVLRLAAVDGLHVQGVTKHEGNVLLSAEVGEPVPGEHALGGDDQTGAIRRDRLKERNRLGGDLAMQQLVASLAEDAQVKRSGVQIDSTVECVLSLVEVHSWPPSGWDRRLSPQTSWRKVRSSDNHVGTRLRPLTPFTIWDRPGPSPNEAIK